MRNIKNILSFLLVLSMVLSYVPMTTLAAEDGICPHHTTHDGACGYVKAVEGKDCTFVCEQCKTPRVDEAVEAVKAQIDALPTVEELSSMTCEEKIALHNGDYLTADSAYNALTEEQKAQVDASKLMALAAYFADPSNLQTVEEHTCNDITWTGITSVGSSLSNKNYYLKNNIICTNNLTISGTVNLCLNGQQLTWTEKPKQITINSGATLNIYDCGGSGTCSLVITNNGSLNIYGGAYGGKYITNGQTYYNQLINNKGILYIHNATIESDIEAINNVGTLTIDDGSFETASTWTNVYCIDNDGGTAKIKGGSFTSSSSHTIYSNTGSPSLTIHGGTFSNTSADCYVLYVTHGTCTINKGTFNACNNATIKLYAPSSCKLEIKGGDFYSSAGKYIISDGSNKDTIEISGGTFTTAGGTARVRASNGGVSGGTFKNGIYLSSLEDKLAEGYAYYQNGEKVTLTNNPYIPALKQNEIKDGDVEVKKISSTYTVTVTTDGNGTASASSASGTAGTEVTLAVAPNKGYQFKEWQVTPDTVTITDNKFTMPEFNVEIKAIFEEIPDATEHKHALSNGSEEIIWTPITKLSEITGPGNYYLDGNLELDYFNRTISGNGTVNLCLNGVTVVYSSEVTVAAGTTLNICDCKTGSVGFPVVNRGTTNIYSGAFVKKITNKDKLNIYGGSFITDDYTASVHNNTGTLVIQNGTFGNNSGNAVENDGGSISISNGNFTSTRCSVFNDDGTLEISGGTYTSNGSYATVDVDGGSATISKGTFTHTNGAFALRITTSATSLIVTDGTFTSTGDAVCGNAGTLDIQGGTFTTTGNDKNVLIAYATVNISGGQFASSYEDKAWIKRGTNGKFQLSGGTFTGGLRLNLEDTSYGGAPLPESLVDGYAYYQNDQVYEFGPSVNTQIIKNGDVTVKKAPVISVAGITLNPSTLSLAVGETKKLTATVEPDKATNPNVTWSSDNEAVARVDEDGKVTAVKVGEATITATAEDGSGVNATCTVTVNYLDPPIGSCIIRGADYVDNDKGVHWFRGSAPATVVPPSGYTISAEQGGAYGESVSVTKPTVYLENESGAQTNAIDLSDILKWDTNPPAGSIALKGTEKTWNGLTTNPVTLHTQKKEITVAKMADESGVKSIEYSVKSEPVSDWTVIDDWKACGESIVLTENAQSVAYVRITDNVGNQSCLSTDILYVDTTAPVISGIADGTTYYTTQKATATDNIALDTLTGTNADNTIPGDPAQETKHTIVATDKAGNTTTFEITMKPISSLAAGLPTEDTVKLTDKDAIEAIKENVSDVLSDQSDKATDAEKTKLAAIIEECNDLLGQIMKAENVIALIQAMPDASGVEPDNKTAIDAYDAALAAYNDPNLPASSKRMAGEENKTKLDAVGKALIAYDIAHQSSEYYVKGSGKTLTFTANGYYAECGSYAANAYGKFISIEVDGKVVDAKNYTAKAGSTVITLKSSYLESLSTGKHTIKVNYIDGSTDGKDTFQISVNNGNPFTGDNNHMMLFGGVAMTSLLCMAMMVMFIPRKKEKYEC